MPYSLLQDQEGNQVIQESPQNPLGGVRFFTPTGEEIHGEILGLQMLNPYHPTPTWAEAPPAPPVVTIQPDPPPVETRISKLEFLNLFSQGELEAMYGAARDNISMTVWINKFNLAEFMDMSDPQTQAGLAAFEAFGLIGPGRSKEILTQLGVPC